MNRLFYIGVFIAIIFIFTAIFAPLIATHDPIKSIEVTDSVTGSTKTLRYAPPSKENWFGTDDLGRDVFSRLVYGARVSLIVGISVVTISAIVGIFIGAIAGFYGGWLDQILSGYIFNVFLAFPGLLLAIAIVAFLSGTQPTPEERLRHLIIALCVTGWVGYARVMRGQVLKVREYDFVQAARALGAIEYAPAFRSHNAERDSAVDRSGFARQWRARFCPKRRFHFSVSDFRRRIRLGER